MHLNVKLLSKWKKAEEREQQIIQYNFKVFKKPLISYMRLRSYIVIIVV